MSSHIRCHYVTPEGFECESWIRADSGVLCPIHKGTVSPSLAANGINKDPYIERRRAVQFSLEQATSGMEREEKLNYLEKHIAEIERVIEEQKLSVLTARALRQIELEGLSEEERKERRKIQTPKQEPKQKKALSAAAGIGKEMLLREKAIAAIMKNGKTREQAIKIVDMD